MVTLFFCLITFLVGCFLGYMMDCEERKINQEEIDMLKEEIKEINQKIC